MSVTRLALTRPVTMIMIIAALLLVGVISFRLLPVQEMPNTSNAFVAVSVQDPGATPEDVLTDVTLPLENAISGVSGIQNMTGLSSSGQSRVTLQFAIGTDVNEDANLVGEAVNRAIHQLPSGASAPTIFEANPNSFPVMNIALSGLLRQDQLYALATNVLQPGLQQVPGVAAVQVQGGLIPQVNVTVSPQRLEAYGVSLQQVAQAVGAQNVTGPGGSSTFGSQTTTVKTSAYFGSAAQLKQLVVVSRPQGDVTLAQVADVQQGSAPATQAATVDGKTSVGLSVTAQSGANVVAVARAVRQKLTQLDASLPQGVQATILNDQSTYIHAALNAVEDDLFLAVLLAGLVLLIFLHRPRNTLIVMLAIPISMVSTFTVMHFLGFSLDLISLLALSLTTAILVDDSIVVLENINRHLAMGKNPWQAALDGRTEIGLAALTLTLTDVVVYGPVAFSSGVVGHVFFEFGLTIVAATLFSLFVSFTVTPMLAAYWLQGSGAAAEQFGPGVWGRFSQWWEDGFDRIRQFYGRLIESALRHRLLVVLLGVAALAVSAAFVLFGWVGTEFVPQVDNSQFNVNIMLPVGTPLSTTTGVVEHLSRDVQAMPGVAAVYATSGAGGGFGGGGENTGGLSVDLLPVGERPPLNDYLAKVRTLGRDFPGASIITSVQNPLRIGGQRAAGILLQGPDIQVLNQLAAEAAAALHRVPGLVGVRNEAAQTSPELAVRIRRNRAAYFGITAQTVAQAVQTAVAGSTVSELRPQGSTTETPIVVTVSGGDHLTPQELENLPIAVATGSAGSGADASAAFAAAGTSGGQALVRLGQVATVVSTTGPAQLTDQNRQLEVTVDASTFGAPLGRVAAGIRQVMAGIALPPGYSYSFTGEIAQQQTVFPPLEAAFALSAILVYMLTAALYESLLIPLAVLFSLPLATVGAMAALALTGNTLNIYSFMGLIMLTGLVAKNSILLIDYTRTLRARGVERDEAVVESGRTRLRPILMTTAVMIFAMLPLALKIGAASEDRSPMAVVIIGGMLTSTLLTLIFVPVMYSLLDDLTAFLQRARQPATGVLARPAGPVTDI